MACGLLTLGMLVAPMSAYTVAPNLRNVVVFKGGEGGSSHYRIPSIFKYTYYYNWRAY